MRVLMSEENKQGLMLAETEKILNEFSANGNAANGKHVLVPTKELPVAKQVSNQQLIAEERLLIEKETEIEKNYLGARGYLRLFQVSKVIGSLALYLYLNQYELHHAQHQKQAEVRLETARRLTW